MKKILSVLLVLAMVLSLAACGGAASSAAPAEAPKEEAEKEAEAPKGEAEKEAEAPKEETAEPETQEETEEPAAEGEKLKVGFSLPSMTFPFYVRMYDQIMEEAEKRGWEVSFVDGNLDTTTQMNGLQDMINNQVDVLIFATWWIDAMPDIFEQCEAQGIPVFLMDNMSIPAGCENSITFTTGTDNMNAGIVGGTWFSKYLKDQGKDSINLILVSSQSEQQVKRCTGFVQGLEDNGITVNTVD